MRGASIPLQAVALKGASATETHEVCNNKDIEAGSISAHLWQSDNALYLHLYYLSNYTGAGNSL